MEGRSTIRPALGALAMAGVGLMMVGGVLGGEDQQGQSKPLPAPAPLVVRSSIALRNGAEALPEPTLLDRSLPAPLAPGQLDPADKPLPINLATALRLAGARPLVIGAAQASVATAAAEVQRAKVLWLPSVYAGAGYYHHDGASQGATGGFADLTREQFMAGGGLKASIVTTEALFTPLAARQVLAARRFDVQAARNDALLDVAQAYFAVQQARGRLAGIQDVVDKGLALRDKVQGLQLGLVAPADINRARALLADYQQTLVSDREAWRIASADLAQVLRLDPTAVIVPIEPPFLQVTLIPPQQPVDGLICIGLTNRPELASQQALVQAALARIRQERLRPLIPSLILEGGPGPVAPGGYLMGGIFASGASGVGNPTLPRDDISVGLVWGIDNLGFGNRAAVHARQAEKQQMVIQLLRVQDMVAADIARAHAQLESAGTRTGLAETEVRQAQAAYEGSIKELGHVVNAGEAKVVVDRTLDVVSALQSLATAYDNYFGSINEYNTAQFRLFRALGYSAQALACQPWPGEQLPVDTPGSAITSNALPSR